MDLLVQVEVVRGGARGMKIRDPHGGAPVARLLGEGKQLQPALVGEGYVPGFLPPEAIDVRLQLVRRGLGEVDLERQIAALDEMAQLLGLRARDFAAPLPLGDLRRGVRLVEPEIALEQPLARQRARGVFFLAEQPSEHSVEILRGRTLPEPLPPSYPPPTRGGGTLRRTRAEIRATTPRNPQGRFGFTDKTASRRAGASSPLVGEDRGGGSPRSPPLPHSPADFDLMER